MNIRRFDIHTGYAEQVKKSSEIIPEAKLDQIRKLVPELAARHDINWSNGFSLTSSTLAGIDGQHTHHDLYPGNNEIVIVSRLITDNYRGGERRTERHIPNTGQPTVRQACAIPLPEEFEKITSWPVPTTLSDFDYVLQLLTDPLTIITPRFSGRVASGGFDERLLEPNGFHPLSLLKQVLNLK